MKNELMAKRIKTAMKDKKINASELARRMGIDRATISRYLNGLSIPGIDYTIRMAEVLEVSPTWLMGMETDTHTALLNFDKLNEQGKKKVCDYIDSLMEKKEYLK